MKHPFKKWLLGLVSLFAVLSLTACGWTGTGQVIEKEYEQSGWEKKRKSDGTTTTKYKPECFELEIVDDKTGQVVEDCYSQRVWNDAMEGHSITITKDYR